MSLETDAEMKEPSSTRKKPDAVIVKVHSCDDNLCIEINEVFGHYSAFDNETFGVYRICQQGIVWVYVGWL